LGILDRVKPNADDPQKVDVRFTNMPPNPTTIAEWIKLSDEMDKITAAAVKVS